MNRVSRAGVWVGALALGAALMVGRPATFAADAEVSSVDKLKSDAFKALRDGRFDRTNELLGHAAELSHDPSIERMAGWTNNFEQQRKVFAGERHEQYEKSLGNVELLLGHAHPDYAIDAAARAYLLADSKEQFRSEPGVDQLVKDEIAKAEQYDKSEQWIKSLRIYSDLGSIEPAIPTWKDKLKLCTRRVRLLALYAPEVLKQMQEGDIKERDEVEALLKPATQPSTQPTAIVPPATQPVADKDKDKDENEFKNDWHDTLRGVRLEMLREALLDAKQNYYREVSFKQLAIGGLNGIEAIVTTRGLEKAFPGLADPAKKAEFVKALDDAVAANQSADDEDKERRAMLDTLTLVMRMNATTVKIPEQVLVSEFSDGAFVECDPFTNMIWPSDVEEFNKTTQGEFSGVGIQIQNDEMGNLKVVSPLEDTPAYKAGIKPDDIITHINGKSAKNISINQAVRTITGPSGTMVTLTIKSPDGRSKDYTIKRETIKVASVKGWTRKAGGGGWDFIIDPENKIAYMRLTNFTKDSPREIEHAVDQIKEAGGKGIILDLRYNPGGLLTSATEIADKFLKEGVIVSTHPDRDTGNPPTVAIAKPEDTDCDLPLVVLVNQYSASASEIVSGALKDHQRALIVGERTFGKGSVQMLFPLADRTAYLKLTTSHYYLPSGRCLHREENSKEWGVEPDVTVAMTPEQMRTAIDSRQDQDILRDAVVPPAQSDTPKLESGAKVEEKIEAKKPKKGILASDPQLSGALLLLKLQLAGAHI